MALAAGLANFTAPHAGRKLRHDLGFLAAFWGEDGDAVLVDDTAHAATAYRQTLHDMARLVPSQLAKTPSVTFVDQKQLVHTHRLEGVEPWGWDAALKALLLRKGVDERLLPTDEQLVQIRQLSSRHLSAWLLGRLKSISPAVTVGEACECRTMEEVRGLAARYGEMVLKAPWSSSGRGIRYLSGDGSVAGTDPQYARSPLATLEGWLRNLLDKQGSVMVEPYYNKVKDFGMEFFSDGRGGISYKGLSLFHTENGAYTGSIIATEAAKRQVLASHIAPSLLDDVCSAVCRELGSMFCGKYRGPFGIDMMLVRSQAPAQPFLHPCVEVNLRRTMGHVALTLGELMNAGDDDELRHVMRIDYTGNNYQLKIRRL